MPQKTKPIARMKVLGELEQDIMDILWQLESATVRTVFERIRRKRRIAYTTVMTIMDRLYSKRMLNRTKHSRTYTYSPRIPKADFMRRASARIIDSLVKDFGDVAIAQFADAIDQVTPEKLEALRKKVRRTS